MLKSGKRYLFFYLGIAYLISGFNSCTSNEIDPSNEGVALYLIDSFSTVENTCQIVETGIITSKDPLVFYADFFSYDSSAFTYLISDESKKRIEDLNHTTSGIAFAIRANGELIYTGYFWPSFSSMGCHWLTADPLFLDQTNQLIMELGYPEPSPGVQIPDRRNDPRILDIFAGDNKLIQ